MEEEGLSRKSSIKSEYDNDDVKLLKQQYLIKEIIEKGYDKVAFCDFMQSLKCEFVNL